MGGRGWLGSIGVRVRVRVRVRVKSIWKNLTGLREKDRVDSKNLTGLKIKTNVTGDLKVDSVDIYSSDA